MSGGGTPPPTDWSGEPEQVAFSAPDGVRLALHRLGPRAGEPVLLVPGTFSNSNFWLGTRGTGFARALAERGFEAWALDPRGHGASARPARAQRSDFEAWARLDVPAAVRRVASERGELFAVGHSAGGATLLGALAAEPSLRGIVRAAVLAATPVPALQRFRRVLARATRDISLALHALALPFPARLLRLGPEDELPAAMAQWMSWNLEGHWRGADGTDYEALLRELTLPALVLAGAGDSVFAPPHAVRGLVDRLGPGERIYLTCGRETGFSRDFGHSGLLVSRAARAEVWPIILDWLEARRGR